MEERYYWFAIVGEDSPLCGEEFLVAAMSKEDAWEIARQNFPDEKIRGYGRVSSYSAETMGLDCY